ncbi:MAG TPA: hypothetical protein VFH74_05870 [Gaiellales bacterium]|nr:hypothetical protein [Gaiellales bacterium]
MARGTDEAQVPLSQVVREAAGMVDPSDSLALVGDFERWFEDDDEPAATVPNLERRLAAALDELDPEGEEPALAVAAAVVSYLATMPRHAPRDAERVIEQALRMQYGDDVPEAITAWL